MPEEAMPLHVAAYGSARRRRLYSSPLIAAALLLAAVVVGTVALGHAPAGATTTTLDPEEQSFLTLLNQYRAAHGAEPLSINDQLEASSTWMSGDMAAKDYWPDAAYCGQFGLLPHCDSTPRNWFDRIAAFGNDPFTNEGENIAGGYFETAQSVLAAWQGSPGHNANMLDPAYNVIGIGRAYGAGGWYWTTDFGQLFVTITPSPATPKPSPAGTVTPSPPPTVSPTPTPTAEPTATPAPTPVQVYGDINCDLTVGSDDALMVLRAAAGMETQADCLNLGDVNCDGQLDAIDALDILRYVVSLPVSQPPGCPAIGGPA